ncbi:MAG: T9SS type A sorting domain-containing protein [Bacteroidales bacterium]|jgi:hypothetical protein|nr:T9SS type A sorting domain-containing protein [Bacteroidales bacterium]
MIKNLLTTAIIALCLSAAGSMYAQSPYIHKVYEYKPAPGQFINKLPEYEEGDNANDMRLKAEEYIANDRQIIVSLGGYGGYIVFGFDHLVENITGKYDFKILGNAFWANANPNPNASSECGSCEPGIVMVSYDVNGNEEPDDEWYELAGSEYYKPETIHDYQITYYKPDENKIPTPDQSYPALNDTTYIRWTTNGYGNGYLYRNTFHKQPYYPEWINEDELVFKGAKLVNNYTDESGDGSYYVQCAFDWGYADNHPNSDPRSNFKIDWAVDSTGQPVVLPGIHFVKVYTGLNQYCGWLGETSTEIMGAQDLHLLNTSVEDVKKHSWLKLLQNPVENHLIIVSNTIEDADVYNMSGMRVMKVRLKAGINYISCENLSKGIYILNVKNNNIKFIKK